MLTERRRTRTDSSIVTVEDPVEYELERITQVPVTAQLSFAAILRGLLRQDPDVIMIGELRDSETALIMMEAALTGHLVLTSTHGNDASAVIQRLQHLGTDRVILSQALSTVVVQRLTRRLCPACTAMSEVPAGMVQSLAARGINLPSGTQQLPKPVGCDQCKRSGYVGRVAVHEMFQFDDVLRNALASGDTPGELINKARRRKRFISFSDSAALMMAHGVLAPGDALFVVASS